MFTVHCFTKMNNYKTTKIMQQFYSKEPDERVDFMRKTFPDVKNVPFFDLVNEVKSIVHTMKMGKHTIRRTVVT